VARATGLFFVSDGAGLRYRAQDVVGMRGTRGRRQRALVVLLE